MQQSLKARSRRTLLFPAFPLILFVALLAGCVNPMGTDRASTRRAYSQIAGNPLSNGEVTSQTLSLLHTYNLDELAKKNPLEALDRLHKKALETGGRDILFALADLSYVAGDSARKSVKSFDRPDPRDYYLGSAVYAYLYLFGSAKGDPPSAFDRRFGTACDLYNFGLGRALCDRTGTNVVARLENQKRRLPVGEVDIQLSVRDLPQSIDAFQEFLISDAFVVRGLSMRNRQPGMGAALIGVGKKGPSAQLRTMIPATAFLRIDSSLADLSSGGGRASLEIYSAFEEAKVNVGQREVPLETDSTVHMAYALNQSFVWSIGRLQFFSAEELIPSNVYLSQPYEPGHIPVVFVHGTFSSPIWWAEMLNTLRADPEIRKRYQFWYFIYNSGSPVLLSAAKLRDSINAKIKELDPNGTDPALREMVVIGHSQGGLLTKLTATETGDKLWASVSKRSVESLSEPTQQEMVRRYFFVEPLPSVKRVVFISTPHRGSFRTYNFVRNLARSLFTVPLRLEKMMVDFFKIGEEAQLPPEMRGRLITSIDGMSSGNPVLRALAEIPVTTNVVAHSIIAVKGQGEYLTGNDGVVEYESAHVNYVESELVVRSSHSCQDKPETIEEVRRILHEHLESLSVKK